MKYDYIMFSGTNVGTHDAPIRCVEYCPDVNVVITGSWDSSVKLWDPRTPCSAGTFTQPDKVHFCHYSFWS
jgi:cell cycle arrest protein BUB3